MYEDDDSESSNPQPEHLRLAGKAQIVTLPNGDRLVVPRMEYVEQLEIRLRKLEDALSSAQDSIKKLQRENGSIRQATNATMRNLAQDIKDVKDRPRGFEGYDR